jgi:hypothetical protein
MARMAVVAAVEGKLAADWTRSPVFGLLNPHARPSGNDAHLRVQYLNVTPEQITIGSPGSNVIREIGVFSLIVNRPKAQVTEAREDAELLQDMFLLKRLAGVVECWEPSVDPFADENDRGVFYVIGVAVPYWHDFLG